MTKEELIRLINESAENITNADQTVKNIETKEVKDVKPAEGITHLNSELPTQKDIEKEVNAAEDPIVPADKDGISKNGGDSNLLEPEKVEAETETENKTEINNNCTEGKVNLMAHNGNDTVKQGKNSFIFNFFSIAFISFIFMSFILSSLFSLNKFPIGINLPKRRNINTCT